MDLAQLLAYRQQIERELKSKEKWLQVHGNAKLKIEITPEDQEHLDNIKKMRDRKENLDIMIEEIKEDPNKIKTGNFARFLGMYEPKNDDLFISINKKDYQVPKWPKELEDINNINFRDEVGKFNRKKNWLKTYYEEQARFDKLIKKQKAII